MTDLTPFERRLSELLEVDSQGGIRPIDRYAVARSLVVAGPSRRLVGRTSWRRSLRPVLVLLLCAAVVVGVTVGSRLLQRVDPVPIELILTPTGEMAHPRDGHAATLLLDGRVLVTGGRNGWPDTGAGGMSQDNVSAELYDPATGRFEATGDMVAPRRGQSSTLLDDGRVLIVGGAGGTSDGTPQAELYDPRTERFTPTDQPQTSRSNHAAVRLLDGSVAIIGGSSDVASATHVEIFDPTTETFRLGTDDALLHRVHPGAVLLPDGRVLVAGGDDTRVAIWDPVTDAVLDLGSGSGAPGRTAGLVALRDGRVVLLAIDASRWTVQVVDPVAQTFSVLAEFRAEPLVDPVLLGDGRVLLLLGARAPGCTGVRALAVDPESGDLAAVGDLPGLGTCTSPLLRPTVTSLPDGSALIAGGMTTGSTTTTDATIVGPARPGG